MKVLLNKLGLFKEKSEHQLSETFTVRDKALDITNRLFADFQAHYYGSDKPRFSGSRPPIDWKFDGLIETSIGYYRPFVDVRNGNVVLLNAYNADALLPDQNEQGQWRLKDTQGVYVVNVLKGDQNAIVNNDVKHLGSKGPDLRRILLQHHNDIRDANFNHLNLYAAELDQAGQPGDLDIPRRVMKLTNGELAYGIFQTGTGEWMVRLYVANEKLETADIDQFMRIEECPPTGFLGRAFSLGQGHDCFPTLEEACQFVFEDWAQYKPQPDSVEPLSLSRAYRIWSGQSPLRSADKTSHPLDHMFRYTYVKAKMIDKFKSHRPIIAGALVAGTSAVPLLRTGKMIATGAAFCTAVGASLLDTFVSESIVRAWNKADRFKTKLMAKVFQKVADEELPHTYMVDNAQNLNRWCPKVDPDVLQHLRPLSQYESNILYDNEGPTPYSQLHDFDYWMSSVQNRFYASVFTPLSENMISAKCPNGLTGLFHLSDNGRTRTSYITYNPDQDIGSTLFIPEQNLKKLQGGGVYKVVHRKGQPLKEAERMSLHRFFQQVHVLAHMEAGEDYYDTHKFMTHIHELFNVAGMEPDDLASPQPDMEEPDYTSDPGKPGLNSQKSFDDEPVLAA